MRCLAGLARRIIPWLLHRIKGFIIRRKFKKSCIRTYGLPYGRAHRSPKLMSLSGQVIGGVGLAIDHRFTLSSPLLNLYPPLPSTINMPSERFLLPSTTTRATWTARTLTIILIPSTIPTPWSFLPPSTAPMISTTYLPSTTRPPQLITRISSRSVPAAAPPTATATTATAPVPPTISHHLHFPTTNATQQLPLPPPLLHRRLAGVAPSC